MFNFGGVTLIEDLINGITGVILYMWALIGRVYWGGNIHLIAHKIHVWYIYLPTCWLKLMVNLQVYIPV